MHAKLKAAIVLETLLLFIASSQAEGLQNLAILPGCQEPAFGWLEKGRLNGFRTTLQLCEGVGGTKYYAIRKFVKKGFSYLLLVEPNQMETRVEPKACLKCRSISMPIPDDSRFMSQIESARSFHTSFEQETGVDHAQGAVSGYFLTIDLCPSRQQGLDFEIFQALSHFTLRSTKPIPVGISISGSWLLHHPVELDWLLEQDRKKKIKITWINHSLTHPFSSHLPIGQNFLLEAGVNLGHEILGMEKLLLENGLIPSIYFRFPGLVSNAELDDKLKHFYLISVGSDAWLAKRESPKLGSIILIHGNKNEPAGVHRFIRWLKSHSAGIKFLPLSNLFE